MWSNIFSNLLRYTVQLKIASVETFQNFENFEKKYESLLKIGTPPHTHFLKRLWSNNPKIQSQPCVCSMAPCSTISERTIHLLKQVIFWKLEKCWFLPLIPTCLGQLTPNSIPTFAFVIWNLVVQCQRDPYTCTQVIVWKLEKCLFLAPSLPNCWPHNP